MQLISALIHILFGDQSTEQSQVEEELFRALHHADPKICFLWLSTCIQGLQNTALSISVRAILHEGEAVK